MSARLGSWQVSVIHLAKAAAGAPVPFSRVRPKGRAANYASRYQDSFRRLNGVQGCEVGPLGPHGGLAIVYRGA